eukprot:10766972-Ditylum_brightwellii.AAC.1
MIITNAQLFTQPLLSGAPSRGISSTSAMTAQLNVALKNKTKDALTIQSYALSFIPREMDTVIQGKEILSLYPRVEYDWVLSEKSYAFTSTKASLAKSDLDAKTKLHLM